MYGWNRVLKTLKGGRKGKFMFVYVHKKVLTLIKVKHNKSDLGEIN